VFSQVEGYLFDYVTDTNAAPEVRGGTQGVFVINPQQMQIHVQQERSSVLGVDL
jgi:hypothetical protein